MEAQQRSEENWRNIKGIWQNTQGSWRGDNADRFESQFWAHFERDIEDHLRALETLDEAINRARAEIRE
jgi:uncharacterized protein YukE